jgi:hypothetical protein
MMRLRSAMATLIAASPFATNSKPDTAEWLLARAPAGSTLSEALDWTPNSDRVQIADPTVFPSGLNSEWVTIPNTPATFQMVISGPPYPEPVAAFLTFHSGTPVSSKPAGLFGVDAGMGSFLTPQAQKSIAVYLKTLAEGWTLYDGLIYDQNNGGHDHHTVFKLPDGSEFAGFSTDGDGGFTVDTLYNARGKMLALVVSIRQADMLIPAEFSR